MELRVTLKSTNTVTINLAELKIIAAAAAYLYLSGFFNFNRWVDVLTQQSHVTYNPF